jgi:putative MATE family efflux protein
MRFFKDNKDIIKLALPISLAIAIPQISFLTNTAFLGKLGERELGVNGIVGIYYLIISMIGYGLSIGVQIQMARRAGERDKEKLTRTFVNGLMLSAFFSLSLMLLSLWVAPLIFGFSLNDISNISLSIDYLFIRIWGLPFLMLCQIFNAFFIAIQKSRFLIYGSLATTVATILFDYLFIFGNYGFPKMGLEGSAIASCLGELAGVTTMSALFFYHKFYRAYPVHHFLRFDWELSKHSLKIAAPLIIQFLFSIGGWQIFFFFVEHLGTKELAASQILRSVFGIASIGTWALATTCNTMVSHAMGEGHSEKVIPTVKRIAKVSVLYAFVLCVLLLIFSREFLSLYRNDDALITLAIPSLRVIVVALLLMSVATVVFNGVVGTGKTWINLSIEITCVLTYLLYCYIVIQKMRLPLQWAWASEFVYWGMLFSTASLYLRSNRWKGQKI